WNENAEQDLACASIRDALRFRRCLSQRKGVWQGEETGKRENRDAFHEQPPRCKTIMPEFRAYVMTTGGFASSGGPEILHARPSGWLRAWLRWRRRDRRKSRGVR